MSSPTVETWPDASRERWGEVLRGYLTSALQQLGGVNDPGPLLEPLTDLEVAHALLRTWSTTTVPEAARDRTDEERMAVALGSVAILRGAAVVGGADPEIENAKTGTLLRLFEGDPAPPESTLVDGFILRKLNPGEQAIYQLSIEHHAAALTRFAERHGVLLPDSPEGGEHAE
jgi:hypothetical protein